MNIVKQISQWEAMRSGRGVQKIGVPKIVYQLNDPPKQTIHLISSPETCLRVKQFGS